MCESPLRVCKTCHSEQSEESHTEQGEFNVQDGGVPLFGELSAKQKKGCRNLENLFGRNLVRNSDLLGRSRTPPTKWRFAVDSLQNPTVIGRCVNRLFESVRRCLSFAARKKQYKHKKTPAGLMFCGRSRSMKEES